MIYRINDMFYSLKGEGQWTGTPMFFVRLSGCNLKCSFCDTDHLSNQSMSAQEIMSEIVSFPTNRVVITGGEPLIHDLRPLLCALQEEHYFVHLETNGTLPYPNPGLLSWVTVSPKSAISTMDPFIIEEADEIKFLCGIPDWKEYIENFIEEFQPEGKLWLMPLAKNIQEGDRSQGDLIWDNVNEAIDFCKQHPSFSLCMQMHKILNIK